MARQATADGEIWVAVEIDLRNLFLQRHPSSGAAEDIACAAAPRAARRPPPASCR